MKAIQLEKPQSFRKIEIAEPPAPGPGEAVVTIHRIGICGTDYSGFLGKMPFFSSRASPATNSASKCSPSAQASPT